MYFIDINKIFEKEKSILISTKEIPTEVNKYVSVIGYCSKKKKLHCIPYTQFTLIGCFWRLNKLKLNKYFYFTGFFSSSQWNSTSLDYLPDWLDWIFDWVLGVIIIIIKENLLCLVIKVLFFSFHNEARSMALSRWTQFKWMFTVSYLVSFFSNWPESQTFR